MTEEMKANFEHNAKMHDYAEQIKKMERELKCLIATRDKECADFNMKKHNEQYATLEHNTFTLDGSYKDEPIIEFETQEQLEASLREWQERLFLTDWIIRAKFDSEINAYAEVSKVTDVQSAIISIRPLDEVTSGRNTKYCAEKSLVHELLHLKLDLADFDNPPIEAVVFSYTQHQKIEQLSKSLIMAKYNIPFDWFKNF